MPPLSHVAWAWAVAAVVLVIAGVAGAAAGQQKPIKSCPGLNRTGLKLHRTVSETVDAQQDLTVFATALAKAGNLASFFAGYDNGINDKTRLGACYQILAPSDAAFGALPRGLLARLLDPANEAELVEVVSYHVIAGYYGTRWECGVYPQPVPPGHPAWENPFPCDARKPCARNSMASQPITFSCDPDTMLLRATGANRTTASINRPPILATNGDVTVIDSVLLPPWLPPVPPTPPPGPSPSQHLYFRGINRKKKRCGQVDAASSIPPMLFRDDAALRDYILQTTAWWGPGRPVTIEAGTCADAGYGKAGDPSDPDSWENIAWTKNMFGSVGFDCIDGNTIKGSTCGCPMGQCPDVPPPDQPLCGLCNAASNRPRRVDFWFK